MMYIVNLPKGSPKTSVSDKNWLVEITYGEGSVDLFGFPDEVIERLFEEWDNVQFQLGATPRIFGNPIITLQLHYTRSKDTTFAGEVIIIAPQGLILYQTTLPGLLKKGEPLSKAFSRLALPILTIYKNLGIATDTAPVLTPLVNKVVDEILALPGVELFVDLKTGKAQEFRITRNETKENNTKIITYTLLKANKPISTAKIIIQPTRREGRVLMSVLLNDETIEEVLITHDEKLLPIAGVANAVEGEIIPETKELIKKAPKNIKQSDEWTFAEWLGENLVKTLFEKEKRNASQ